MRLALARGHQDADADLAAPALATIVASASDCRTTPLAVHRQLRSLLPGLWRINRLRHAVAHGRQRLQIGEQ